MLIEINNLTKELIEQEIFKKVSQEVLLTEGEDLEVSIVFLNPEKIRKLNQKYRGKNQKTDVLSFSYEGKGEIVLAPEVIKREAKKLGLVFQEELIKRLIHGLLHLSGYNHQEEDEANIMEKKQDYYLKLWQKKKQ